MRKEFEEPPPTDHPVAKMVYDSWNDLDTLRTVGLAVSCLPWDKVVYYAQARYGLDLDSAMFFWDVAHVADMRYLGHLREKKQNETPPPSEDKKTPRPTRTKRRG